MNKKHLSDIGPLLGELIIAKHGLATLVEQAAEHAARIKSRANAIDSCIQRVELLLREIEGGQGK